MSVKFSFSNLSLILFIGIISTVTLSENLQVADGLLASATKLIYEMELGETQMLTWAVTNNEDESMTLELYALGPGSELLVFEEFIDLESKTRKEIEVFVIVPKDHKDNVEYHPQLFALKRGNLPEGTTGMQVNLSMRTIPVIKIGDNPVYTPPTVEQQVKVIEEKIVKETQEPIVIKETIEEKLARIQAANEANKPDVVSPTEKQVMEKEQIVEKTPKMDQESTYKHEPTPEPESTCGAGAELVDGYCQIIKDEEQPGGSCLIATAAYGTELAPQVQLLREIRDNTLFSTTSGTAFMTGFNTLYYSFAPTIADMERENPMFQEAVRAFITPMISTLSIMSLADDGSEEQVLGLGISVIILNIGMYVGIPIFGIVKLYQFRKN